MQQDFEPPKKKGLFSQKKEPEFDYSSLAKDISVVGRRIRVLEDRYTNLNRKSQVTEQNMINNNKKMLLEIKTINSDINDLKNEFETLRNTVRQIIDELKKAAKKEDVKMLEKYVDLWETVNFVTRNQVEKMIKESLHEKNS